MGGETGKKVGRGFLAFFTLGASEAIMGAMNATDAIGSAGDLMEQLGASLGVITATIQKNGENLAALLEDVDGLIETKTGEPGEITKLLSTVEETVEDFDDLFVIERLTPRSESELWSSELSRLKALQEERQRQLQRWLELIAERDRIVKILKSKELPGGWLGGILPFLDEALGNLYEARVDQLNFDSVHDVDTCLAIFSEARYSNMDEIRGLCSQLRNVIVQMINVRNFILNIDKEINHILFNEPGLIPIMLYNVNEVIERFNTLEQPRIEDILDSVDDNLEESKEILEQVKKLFVIKKKVPVPVDTLPQIDRAKLDWLGKTATLLESRVMKGFDLSDKVGKVAEVSHPVLEIAEVLNP